MTGEERCEISDLPISMCAHCKDPSSQLRLVSSNKEPEYPAISRTFEAQYDNDDGCHECGEDIHEGDRVAFVNNRLCCLECVNIAREKTRGEVDKFTKAWRRRNRGTATQ